MKKTVCLALLSFAIAAFAVAGEEHGPKPHALFDRLKPLVGTWEMDANGEKLRTIYTLGSKGSTLVENLMPGKADMLDVIHADGDALMMTHYCAAANQPRYRATKFDGNSIAFTFHDGTNIGDSYMSGVTLTLVDSDHLIQEWTSFEKGKVTPMKFMFTRVK